MEFSKYTVKRCLCMTTKPAEEQQKQNANVPQVADDPSGNIYELAPVQKGQIRILLLQPGHDTDPIQCSMEVASLADDPCYAALSYCWGDATKERKIACHGYDVPITKSLFVALHNLRDAKKQLRMWVDALCINQQNLPERSEQVAQMNEIYTKADNVIAWLGESQSADELVYHIMEDGVRRLHKRCTPSKDNFQPYDKEAWHDKTLLGQLDGLKALGIDLHSYDVFRAFHNFAIKAYFFRAWITQEVLLARRATLTCGKLTMDLDEFFETFHYIRCRMPDISPWPHFQACEEREGLQKMLFARRITRRGRFQDNVLTMIHGFFFESETRCFEPLDRVYAFRGLISQDARDSIVVDYSLEPMTLFRQVLIEYIFRQQPSDYWLIGWSILYGNSMWCTKKGVPLPSWVPDFSKSPQANEVLCFLNYNMLNGCEYADWQSIWVEGETIAVRGLVITRVSDFFRFPPPGLDLAEWQCDECKQTLTYVFEKDHFAALSSLQSNMSPRIFCTKCLPHILLRLSTVLAIIVERLRTLLSLIASSTGQPYGELHWKTRRALCMNVNHMKCREIPIDAEALPDIWIRLTQSVPDLGKPENWTGTHPMLQSLTQSNLDDLSSSHVNLLFLAGDNQGFERVFGMTEDGRCAWLPKETQAGDAVAAIVLSGARRPTILRGQEDGCYRIVGSAYVERMMIGELLPDTEEELEDIWIS